MARQKTHPPRPVTNFGRQVVGGTDAAEEYLVHRKAYAVLIKAAYEQNLIEGSRFSKDVLRIITVIA
jgi:hypothetical protein